MLTQTVMVFATTIQPVRHKTAPVLGVDIAEGKADAAGMADKNMLLGSCEFILYLYFLYFSIIDYLFYLLYNKYMNWSDSETAI